MKMGNDSVGFVTITAGTPARLGTTTPVPTTVTVTGCRFRPVSATEEVTDTDVSTVVWRCTAPPDAAALAAQVTGQLVFGPDTYEITGVRPFTDERGRPYKVSIDCQRQEG